MANETREQMAVANWLRWQYPDVIFTISPAGVRRGSRKDRIRNAIQARRMGYQKNTPDMLILEPVGSWHGLMVEMKDKTGTASPEQVALLDRLRKKGYYTAICYGYDEAIKTIEDYMKGS